MHQQTQRTYAIGNGVDEDEGRNALLLLDANLQVVATVEAVEAMSGDDPIRDLAVHGDQVIVLTGNDHAEGSGLRLLDLDGRFLRTIAAAQFRRPQAVAASHGRAFVVDEGDDDGGAYIDKVLYVIDIQSGNTLQKVHVGTVGETSAILVDSDEVYIADFGHSKVEMYRFAGSEA